LSAVQPTAPIEPALIAGRYRIQRVLAKGGMGTVYSVADERAGQTLALKRMRAPVSAELRGLFEREYRTLASIQHPRIIRVYDYGVDDRQPFYTMELVQGRDAQELAPVPYAQACQYLRDVATCLALLHTRRLVHRDVTPRNVRVTPDGHCKLLDFGALTSFGIPDRAVGTPPCMPPEALHGAALDQRADLFALGALAYFMLTKCHAYPARELRELPSVWAKRPAPPSRHVAGIPKQLDTLILGLLSLDPAARPSSAAEVVERLNALTALPAEDAETQRCLAESYFVRPQFVGCGEVLTALNGHLTQLEQRRGGLVLLEAESGLGRTRLLGELVLQAQLAGIASVSVDAAMHRQPHGTGAALVEQLLVASPAALQEARNHAALLCQLDGALAARLDAPATAPETALSGDWRARVHEALHAVVRAACDADALLLAVDNLEDADEASLALLAGLQALVTSRALLICCSVSWPSAAEQPTPLSRRLLQERSTRLELRPLTAQQIFELAHSLFGDAPNLARFAEWLHNGSAGRPTHCMALVRTLHAQGVLRYRDGTWTLPADSPETARVPELDELLSDRVLALSEPAQRLAESVAVSGRALSRERAAALAGGDSAQQFALFEELVCADVLQESSQGFRFTHGALRKLLLTRLSPQRSQELHRRCAELLLADVRRDNALQTRINAGWHLLQAGDETPGADLLAEVAYDSLGISFAIPDMQIAAPALEAALSIYTRQARSAYQRLPLLTALAHSGYYTRRDLGERYGEPALNMALDLSGIALGTKLQRWLGKTPGLLLGLAIGWLRFRCAARRKRRYPFRDVVAQALSLVATLSGMHACALDAAGGKRALRALAGFAHLPEHLTAAGIRAYSQALIEIARENQAHALRSWRLLIARFQDPAYYRLLPARSRPAFIGGLWFACGAFESFRDGDGALQAARELERSGLKIYGMIASQVRALYHAYRGELELAREQAREVELHALQLGTASQVELWEPAAMILAYTTVGDVVELRRVAERLRALAPSVPSLARYAQLAELALDYVRWIAVEPASLTVEASDNRKNAEAFVERAAPLIESAEPRSFIGWGATCGYLARALNALDHYAQARAVCEKALATLDAEDRAFVALFLDLELELAVAEAGLGEHQASRQRLEALLLRHADSDNPLTHGRLHEAYARSAALAPDWAAFRHQLAEARRWYRSTGTPALLARVDALARLEPWRSPAPPHAERVANDNMPGSAASADAERRARDASAGAEQTGAETKVGLGLGKR
jgi:hypothetical protein